jgi:hypothetical protein
LKIISDSDIKLESISKRLIELTLSYISEEVIQNETIKSLKDDKVAL